MKENLNQGLEWLTENWIIVALIISEVAALLPIKAKGILQGVVKAGNRIYKRYVVKS